MRFNECFFGERTDYLSMFASPDLPNVQKTEDQNLQVIAAFLLHSHCIFIACLLYIYSFCMDPIAFYVIAKSAGA